MNKFSTLILFFCLCSTTIRSANGVHLENLCAADRFEYKKVEVNSFHRIGQNVTFEPMSHYLVGDSVQCDPNGFKHRQNYLNVLKIKEQ